MEPKYHDGDVLLVQNSEGVEVGEAGIFVLDGAGYFKVYGGDCLISLNPEYGRIMLKDFENVSCIGKVLGRLRRR
jgi:phage repressor protein C with HTH and peptisase S24 domain